MRTSTSFLMFCTRSLVHFHCFDSDDAGIIYQKNTVEPAYTEIWELKTYLETTLAISS
jgi:hypothetical protein